MTGERQDTLEDFCRNRPKVSVDGRFTAGTVFGDWRLTAFIGRGGSGEVYCAEHVSLGTSAAVKVLVREDERSGVRFEKEAKLLSGMKSLAFPRFFAYGEANGAAYLAMELLEPGDLPHRERAVADFLVTVCEGVAELHSNGFVHRDIKPGNILYRLQAAAMVPVICDLGLVKEISSDSSVPVADATQSGAGTPGFGAPEQMERGEVSILSDVHALGVLTDRCFEGKPPWRWRRIIQCATSSIPERRYPSVAAFARAVRFVGYRRILNVIFLFLSLFCGPAVIFLLSGDQPADETGGVSHVVQVWNTGGKPVLENHLVERNAEPTEPKFPAFLDLKGETVKMEKPVVLEGGHVYLVIGPGTLDADISGPTNALLRLKDCFVINRTKALYPKNGIRYSLEKGVYLNFINFKESELPLSLRRWDFLGRYDGAFNVVMFGGPETKEEVERLRNAPVIE